MTVLIIFPIYLFFFVLLNYFFLKKKILLDNVKSSEHKNFLGKNNVPISGGILAYSIVFFFLQDITIINKLIFLVILIIGILSDTNKLISPSKRLIFQTLLIIFYLYINKLFINETRIIFLDFFLEKNFIFKLLFTALCILILVNGVNFIDGTNILAGGYILSVLTGLSIFLIENDSIFSLLNIQYLICFLILFLIFNFFSKSYLGDGGSYLLSIILGIICINFANYFQYSISPFYIALLLWYPALENLISIIRRSLFQKKNVNYADSLHLHHLIYKFLNLKFKKNSLNNPITGVVVNVFIFIFIFLGTKFANQTMILVYLISIKTFIYIYVYLYLLKKFKYK